MAIPASILYCFGIPYFFWWIVRRYKKKKMLDDESIQRIIGWMHRPYKKGREWFLSVELLRKLILTSWIGFMARSCHYKLLMSQLVSFAFILLFFTISPYRSKRHFWLQAVSMIIPALGMSWALVGRAESAADAAKGGTGYDVYGLIIIHLLLIAPVIAGALFGLLATLWLLVKAALLRSADAIAFAAHQTAALAAHNKERLRRKTVTEKKKREEEKAKKDAEKAKMDAVLAAKYLAKKNKKKEKKKSRGKSKLKRAGKSRMKSKMRGKKRRRRPTQLGALANANGDAEPRRSNSSMKRRGTKKQIPSLSSVTEEEAAKEEGEGGSDFDSIDSFSTSSEDEVTHEHHHHHHHGRHHHRHHLLGGSAGETKPRRAPQHNLRLVMRTAAWAKRAKREVLRKPMSRPDSMQSAGGPSSSAGGGAGDAGDDGGSQGSSRSKPPNDVDEGKAKKKGGSRRHKSKRKQKKERAAQRRESRRKHQRQQRRWNSAIRSVVSGVHDDHAHHPEDAGRLHGEEAMTEARHLHEWSMAAAGARERAAQIAAGRRSRRGSTRSSTRSSGRRRRSSTASQGASADIALRRGSAARRGSVARLQGMIEAQKRRSSAGSNNA